MKRPTVNIAMWSGPRNISTAMMRAFENRADCVVSDEPLYGPYLHATGKAHPGAAEIIEVQGSDWRRIVERLVAPPATATVWYQKHMTHHLLDHMPLDWTASLANCFLLRDPAEVLASYRQRRGEFSAEDLGFPQQLRLFEAVCQRDGEVPAVLDSADVLRDPRGMLGRLCRHLGIDFDEAMLHWPAGPRDSDGVWGRYWYDAVWASTGFAPYRAREVDLADDARRIVDQCRPAYEALYRHRLRPPDAG